ncbi:MAG: hypothetical protein V4736_14470 [Bdellovibrionota bacterium]
MSKNTIKTCLSFVGVLTLLLFIAGCSFRGCQKQGPVNKESDLNGFAEPVVVKKIEDPRIQRDATRLRILIQALAVERAAWKVLLDTPENQIVVEFYPLVRALGKNQSRVPVPQGKSICDQFEVRKTDEGSWFTMNCRRGNSPFAFMKESDGRIQVEFFPKELSDVIGLAASLSSKNIKCDLTWSKNTLDRMTCHNLSRNRQAQEVIELDDLIYTAEGESVLKIKGRVLKDLYPISKIETNVPVKGAIELVETWLPPPPVIEEPTDIVESPDPTKDPNNPDQEVTDGDKPIVRPKKIPKPVSPTAGGEGSNPDTLMKNILETDQGESSIHRDPPRDAPSNDPAVNPAEDPNANPDQYPNPNQPQNPNQIPDGDPDNAIPTDNPSDRKSR